MMPEGWVLTYKDEKCYAALIKYLSKNVALFVLSGKLGPYREGNNVIVNLKTLECELSKIELYIEDAA